MTCSAGTSIAIAENNQRSEEVKWRLSDGILIAERWIGGGIVAVFWWHSDAVVQSCNGGLMTTRILVLFKKKGGTGASTIAENISVCAARAGKRVLCIDTDTQRSLERFGDRRSRLHNDITVIAKYGDIGSTLKSFREQNAFDLIIVDCAGADSKSARTALLHADVVLTPFRNSQHDIESLVNDTDEVVRGAQSINERLVALAIMNMVSTNSKSEMKNAKEALEQAETVFKLMPEFLSDRIAFRNACTAGEGVVELKCIKSKGEMMALYKRIDTVLNDF